MSQDKIPMIADPLVQATVTLENGEETVLTGLNDITFRRSIQTIKADVYLNKQLFERFNGDGDSVFQLQRAQLLITSH
ncbi:inorganic polyphosphate/ATP-NAD kinase [Lactobacillus amylovorus]|uniref:Inorganic polyphosphate/ATP-NAD kinase n=1 Tax=Lactobacillus amylovorus TaxID=1604 RepID=F0TEY9_LACAM|nr:inorganic polyphosphate kinase [Lactobacillus amylovorus]ADZ07283.1 inorganic polyphosphate/ATP-NAD kinase [Lactobacillus amylovorus]AEA32041.1 inorganic polyphosphate/ATP-NAD kinase [Lactobacillus amylovorus GRL1118]MDB6228458.1 inorganic polyphosphate kinase [Lactobacillus amylovorus]MDF9461865.1 inorganic polyphosphate kinase [Lactobacillus amylovorus]